MIKLRFVALLLGFSGVLTYSLLWLAIRVFGSVPLSFGIWGPEWVLFFELWIEPIILAMWLGLTLWVLRYELNQLPKVKQGE